MKKLLLVLTGLILYLVTHAQQINIPGGSKPLIDGIISNGEWDDAGMVSIAVNAYWTIDAYYKHGDSSLFFAFTGLVGMYGQRYPDVMLDLNNDKSTTWQADDWWFHASYNDCEGHGNYNVWASCQPTHPGWWANNFPLGQPGNIEIGISYSKIGLLPFTRDTIGISLEVSDTYTNYHYFPNGSDIGDPSTWAVGVIDGTTSGIREYGKKIHVLVFLNPSMTQATFSFPNPENTHHGLTIFNANGQIVREINNITGEEITVNLSGWIKGLYFFNLYNKNGNTGHGKFFIR